MPPNVAAYYILEDGLRTILSKSEMERPEEPAVAPSHDGGLAGRLKKLVHKGLGSLKADKSKTTIYHVAEGSCQVRKTLAIDNFINSDICCEEPAYVATVRPLVHQLFGEGAHDSVVIAGGTSGTSKMKLLHGSTLDLNYDGTVLPPKSAWGVVMRALEDLIPLAAKHNYNIHVSAVRTQLDSVVDSLVSPATLTEVPQKDSMGRTIDTTDKKPSPRIKLQRMLALTSANALSIDDYEETIVMPDMIVIPVREMEDFRHVVNCFAASNTSRIRAMAANAARMSPFNYVISFRLCDAVNPARNRVIIFVEQADYDWTTIVPEDMHDFKASSESIINVLAAISSSENFEADAKVINNLCRGAILSRIVFTDLSITGLKVAFFGHSRFATSLEMMEHIAACRNVTIGIVLHGPDREGESDVDPELREHIEEIQKECDALKHEMDVFNYEKRTILSKIQCGDENLARLEQRRATLRRMTVASIRQVKNNDEEIQQRRQQELMARLTHQQNCLRLQVLERELSDLNKEEENREAAAKKQLKFVNDEKERCHAKCLLLQKECDTLTSRASRQQQEYDQKKAVVQAEGFRKAAALLDKNRVLADKANQEARQAIQTEYAAAKKQGDESIKKEMRRENTMSRIAQEHMSVNESRIAIVNTAEAKDLEVQLHELRSKRQQLEKERVALTTTHRRQLDLLDSQAAVLSEYAFKMSGVLASIEKRIPAARLIHIPVFEPTMRHNTDWLVSRCNMMRSWLEKESHAEPPRYQLDIPNGCFQELNEQPVPRSSSFSGSPVPNQTSSRPMSSSGSKASRLSSEELKARMIAEVSRHNRGVEIAKEALERSQNRPSTLQ